MNITGFLSIGFLGLTLLSSTSSASDSTVKSLMHDKLESAHGILEGLVTNNFLLIETHAARLRDISQATSWYKPTSEDFLANARSFRNAADDLITSARAKNIEGVSLGYVRLTLECVKCHRDQRDVAPKAQK